MAQSKHEFIERSVGWMIVLTLLVVSIGGLVEIVPLFFQKSTTTPVEGLKPYDPLRLIGRDIYVREGCYNCHSQMIRPSAPRQSVTVTTRWPASMSMIARSSGARSVLAPTSLEWADATPTSGTGCICAIRGT